MLHAIVTLVKWDLITDLAYYGLLALSVAGVIGYGLLRDAIRNSR